MTSPLLFHVENHIGIITLNRVDALNALSLPMILQLQEILSSWDVDDNIHVIVVRSASEKAFCAGGDVRWLYETGLQHSPLVHEFFQHEYRLNQFIHDMKTPYIAWMNGITMGGGVGISLHGSHPVACDNFLFAMPETSIGFFPDIGASFLLSRCRSHYGIYLGLTGQRLCADDAKNLGLVKYVLPHQTFSELLRVLCEQDLSQDAHMKVDHCLNTLGQSLSDVQNETVLPHETFVKDCFQYTHLEEIMQALVQGDDVWHQKTRTCLADRAPLSLKVTLSQLLKARTLSLADCLVMDGILVKHFMRDSDFYEGVRALLVDKDKSPRWNPASFDKVSQDRVHRYFECL